MAENIQIELDHEEAYFSIYIFKDIVQVEAKVKASNRRISSLITKIDG